MTQNQSLKTVIWLSSTKKELQNFPLPVRKTVGFALYQAQEGKKHIHAKPLKDFSGAGILEIVADYDGDTYRAVYTVKLANCIYVLHVFQKKSKTGIKTPKSDLDLIKKRLKLAETDYQTRQPNQP